MLKKVFLGVASRPPKSLDLRIAIAPSGTGIARITLYLLLQLANLAAGAGQVILTLAGIGQPVGLSRSEYTIDEKKLLAACACQWAEKVAAIAAIWAGHALNRGTLVGHITGNTY